MFHNQHVFTHGMYLLFCFFMPCPEPPMGISGVGSFPVQSGDSLIFFQLFRCWNLALNRVFSYFLVAGMIFILRGVWMPPHLYAPICLYAPYVCTPPRVYTHPHIPHTPLCICMFLEVLYVVGGCKGLPVVLGHFPYTTLFLGVPPLHLHPPTLSHWLPVHQYVQGYQYVMWAFSLLLKGLGVFPHQLGGLGGITT